ncbi:hypothetical protein DFJ58DRAFT_844361 [Suillus subalutaceus]|uniref:uncharacterized protein n=1 Tax=Suillus subalutaceus TaxID=48586 RepID=UPI001B86320B|nr:uncharacterized protein DFJ58DRAFT_844361 [Suillus subalutaceus]KAG1843373.1 hypothetical protein DFJ58DRAFT_844361 [Suillus subalutaceus]
MWPEKVQRQFDIAQAAGNDALENVMHAPYNKLLNTLHAVRNFLGKSACLCAAAQTGEGIFGEILVLYPSCTVSALSGRSSVSTLLTQAGLISPEPIPASTQYVIDTAPVDRWNYDILTAEGEAELRRIVQLMGFGVETVHGIASTGWQSNCMRSFNPSENWALPERLVDVVRRYGKRDNDSTETGT